MTQQEQTVAVFGAAADRHQEHAGFLKTAMVVLLVGSMTSLAFQRVAMPGQTVRLLGPLLMIAVVLVARYLLAHERVRAALYLMVVGAWTAVTTVVALTNGVESPLVLAYPLLILTTGWLIGTGAALWMAALTIVVTVGLALAEGAGFLAPLATPPPGFHAGTQVFLYTLAAALVCFAMRAMQSREQRLNQVHRELMQRTLDLETSQAELSAAQAVANVGSWVYDFTNDTMHLSAETCRIFGLPQGSKLSLAAYSEGIHEDDRPAIYRAREAAMQGAAFDIEYRVRVGDGIRWVRSKAELERAPDGSALRVLGIAQDITERKRTEAALLVAKAEAEEANRAKSSFLTAVGHDLGQPISALALMIGALEQSVPAVPTRLLQNMRECVKGISGLLSDLMDVSKLDAGVVLPTPSDWSVNELLNEIMAVHAVEAQAKGLRLRLRATDAWTYTDRKLMQRVVGNLVSNAIRYTERGGVLVACRRRAGKHWVEVWDTGIGIARDKLGRAFEEFAQLNDADRTIGSGLGLSIVAKTSQLLGLQMRVQSTPGKGSLFAIELPTQRWCSLPAARDWQATRRIRRIALVEDNALLLDSLVFALEATGFELVAASTIEDLLARLGGQRPDIVISDFHLTNAQTGADAIAALRAVFGPELPCLVITADTGAELHRSLTSQQIPVLQKPLDIDAFLAFIHESTGDTPMGGMLQNQ